MIKELFIFFTKMKLGLVSFWNGRKWNPGTLFFFSFCFCVFAVVKLGENGWFKIWMRNFLHLSLPPLFSLVPKRNQSGHLSGCVSPLPKSTLTLVLAERTKPINHIFSPDKFFRVPQSHCLNDVLTEWWRWKNFNCVRPRQIVRNCSNNLSWITCFPEAHFMRIAIWKHGEDSLTPT